MKADIRPVAIKYTDHQAVSIILDIKVVKRGPGYWKLNNSLLDDEQYIKIIDETLDTYNEKIEKENIDIQITWEMLKIEIKGKSIQYGIRKAQTRIDEIKCLENKLEELLSEKYKNDQNIQEIQTTLENKYEMKAKGAQIRSRIKWIEEGERNSKYFLTLEKKRQSQKSINEINDKKGNKETDQSKVLDIIREFYENLYKTNKPDKSEIRQFIHETIIDKKLSDNDSAKLEGVIDENECYKAIQSMRKNKSPGNDGISLEFYIKFWNKIKIMLIKVLNTGYEKGRLSNSQRTGMSEFQNLLA